MCRLHLDEQSGQWVRKCGSGHWHFVYCTTIQTVESGQVILICEPRERPPIVQAMPFDVRFVRFVAWEVLPELERGCVGDNALLLGPIRRLGALCVLLERHGELLAAAVYDMDSKLQLVSQLLEQVHAALNEQEGRTRMNRILAAPHKIKDVQWLHLQIDALLEAVPPRIFRGEEKRVVTVLQDWRGSWESERERHVEYYESVLDEVGALDCEAAESRVEMEVLAVLKFELDSFADSHTASECSLLERALSVAVDRFQAVMVTIPEWFIPPNQVRTHESLDGVQEWNGVHVTIERLDYLDGESAYDVEEQCIYHLNRWHDVAHVNILRTYGGCHVGEAPFLVYEFAKSETLLEQVRTFGDNTGVMWQHLFEAACGLKHIHGLGLVHGHIGETSIVLGADNQAKIDTRPCVCSIQGGDRRLPEQSVDSCGLSPAADVFLFGVYIIDAMIRSSDDCHDTSDRFVSLLAEDDVSSDRPVIFSASLWALLQKMCASDPHSRVDMEYVVQQIHMLVDYSRPWSDDLYPELLMVAPEVWTKFREVSLQRRSDVLVCSRVLDRLEHVLSRLWDDISDPDNGFWLTRTENLVRSVRFCIANYLSNSVLFRLAQFRSFMEEIQTIHAQLDVLFAEFENVQGAMHGVLDWKQQWEFDHSHVLDFFEGYLIELQLSGDMVANSLQIATFLQYELDNFSYLHTLRESRLIVQVLEICRSQSQTSIVSTPDWFIPPYAIRDWQWWEGVHVVVHHLPDAIKNHEYCIRQADMWSQLVHPHIVKLFGACHVGRPFFVYEHARGGTLRDYCASHGVDNQHFVLHRLHEAALGLQYLHEREIVHNGLRCENILLIEVKDSAFQSSPAVDGSDSGSVVAKLSGIGLVSLRNRSNHHHFQTPLSKQEDLEDSWRTLLQNRMDGDGTPSLASDIFDLGLCIVKALTELSASQVDGSSSANVDSEDQEGDGSSLLPAVLELVDKMCALDPDQRVRISYVVHQLNALARSQTDACDDDHDSESSTENDDVVSPFSTFVLSNFRRSSIPDILRSCARRVMSSGDQVGRQIYNRLADIRQRLEVDDRVCRLAALRQFAVIAVQFRAFVNTSRVQKKIAELASLGFNGSSKYFSFHKEIDQLVEALELTGLDSSIHDWKPTWYRTHSTSSEDVFEESLSLLEDLDDTFECEETMTLLQFELNRRGTSYSETQVDAIYAARLEVERRGSTKVKVLARTLPKWFIPPYEVQFNEFNSFSHGSFASVHMGTWLNTPVVIKNLTVEGQESDPEMSAKPDLTGVFEREVYIWHHLNHPHIVKLYGACHVGGHQFFVCEHAAKGTLDTYLRAENAEGETWQKLLQAALGLQYLHQHGVVHGDLKCDNILVGADGAAKLTDFGLSAVKRNVDSSIVQVDRSAIGALRWKAPECLKGEEPTFESDIYSFGMCIVQAVSGEYPWGMVPDPAVRYHVKKGKLPRRPDEFSSDEQWSLVKDMCRFDPAQRLPMAVVVQLLTRFADRESMRYRRSSRVLQLLFDQY